MSAISIEGLGPQNEKYDHHFIYLNKKGKKKMITVQKYLSLSNNKKNRCRLATDRDFN